MQATRDLFALCFSDKDCDCADRTAGQSLFVLNAIARSRSVPVRTQGLGQWAKAQSPPGSFTLHSLIYLLHFFT
ncbi:hypothetical protein SAMD00079811_10380 [Scytonema sp. HK-05]|nr:hypothetical protein SAMD00079811_10380 [Scytonema sp. HK-05]